ncbi:MAG: helix-turn-helix transcriptional regulator [Ruminococcaceae bacterium]|nr:helix-turn-helix transcriptional regulator [Oscillospiraceae bacterium]
MEKEFVSNSNDALTNAKDYLYSNPFCSNSQLAQMCKISVPYLYKIFKQIEKETPNSYRQKVMCDKAKDLLRATDFSIEEISRMLEFSSSGYFRTIFKKHIGMTPIEYRKLFYF